MNNRVVLLIRNVMPEYYGGGETYQLMLASELVKHGFSPIIVTSSIKLLKEAEKCGIKAISCPFMRQQNWSGWRNLTLPKYYLWQIVLKRWYKKLFKKYRPIVVNIQSRDDWLAATPVAKKMRIKTLWTDHMDFRSWVLTNVNVNYKNLIGKEILREAKSVDKIIFISDYERKSFEKTVGSHKFNNLVTIKNGVIDKFDQYKKIKSKNDSFCYIGRVVNYKGIKELIEAFKEVNKKHPKTILNIYGDGKDIDYYRGLAHENNKIKFYGRTDKPLEAMAENEFFVLPSYREGLSLSLLDAVMMGKKIIASSVDGNLEVIDNKKSGLLVPARDVKELTEAMLYMLEHPEIANSMAENARRNYEDNFNLEKIFVEKMLPLYNNEKE